MDKSHSKRKAEATLIPTKKAGKTKSIVVQDAKKVASDTKAVPKPRKSGTVTKPYARSMAKPVSKGSRSNKKPK